MAKSPYEDEQDYKRDTSGIYNWYGKPDTSTNLVVPLVLLGIIILGAIVASCM